AFPSFGSRYVLPSELSNPARRNVRATSCSRANPLWVSHDSTSERDLCPVAFGGMARTVAAPHQGQEPRRRQVTHGTPSHALDPGRWIGRNMVLCGVPGERIVLRTHMGPRAPPGTQPGHEREGPASTSDKGFARFDGLKRINPLAA